MKKYFSIPMEMELKNVGSGYVLKTENIGGTNEYVAENTDGLKNIIKRVCEDFWGKHNPQANVMYKKVCTKFELN